MNFLLRMLNLKYYLGFDGRKLFPSFKNNIMYDYFLKFKTSYIV